MAVHFFLLELGVKLSSRRRLKQFIGDFFISKGRSLVSLNIIFCSDDYLLQINKDFLQHEYYTDIVTFNLSNDPQIIEGEIYISIDRVKENALKNSVTVNNEQHRIIFHGILHLCGFKDKLQRDKTIMTDLENEALNKYFR